MTYLVTGGAGFIGAHIVRHLADKGESVVAVDLRPDEAYFDAVLGDAPRDRVALLGADVADLPALQKIIGQHEVHTIIHLASVMHLATNANPHSAFQSTGLGTLNVFEAARVTGVRKVVWSSSAGVYGDRQGAIDEHTPPAPSTVYGALKLGLEHASGLYRSQHGVDITAVRYNMIYGYGRHLKMGPGRPQQQLLPLIEFPALGMSGRVEYGDTPFEWCYIDDAASATLLAAACVNPPLLAYNVHGHEVTYRQVADLVLQLLPDAEIEFTPGSRAGVRIGAYDPTAIERDLGYRPQFSMLEGLRATINAIRSETELPLV